MSDSLKIECGPADNRGVRLVIASLGSRHHRSKFDCDNSFQRRKFREEIIALFELGDDANEAVENAIIAAADGEDASAESAWQPSTLSAASIQPIKADWFWQSWIPAGSISVCDGDPGLGKSQATIDIAARCSRGDCMPPQSAPNGTFTPGSVLLSNVEDDPARVIVPRLIAASARLERIHLMRDMSGWEGEESRLLSLPGDLPNIEKFIQTNSIVLWVLDPFVAFIDGKLSVNSDADVRRCLGQLAATAERTGCAVLLVRHLNKKSGGHAIYRGGGSIGITGAARSVFMVGEDPEDSNSRILASVKSNLCEAPASLRFHIEAYGDTSRIVWGESCDLQAHDLLGQERKPRGGSKKEQAASIITGVLTNGPRGESEVLSEIESAGISRGTYFAARKSLGVVSEKTGYQGLWMLSLPNTNGVCHDDF